MGTLPPYPSYQGPGRLSWVTYLPSQDKECEEEDEEGDSSHEFGLLQHPWPEEATDQGCPLPCPLHDGFPLPPVPMEPSAFLLLYPVGGSGQRGEDSSALSHLTPSQRAQTPLSNGYAHLESKGPR